MKIHKLIPMAAAPLLMALLPASASAAPLDPAHVPEDAKWVIHVDLKALSETELAERVRENRGQMAVVARTWLQSRYGLDPREGLESVTMFSNTYDSHTGTMILKADYDRAKVQANLEERPDVQRQAWGDHTLYTIRQGEFRFQQPAAPEATGRPPRGERLPQQGAQPVPPGGQPAPEGAQRLPQEAQPLPQRAQRSPQRAEAARGGAGQSMTILLLDDSTAIFASSPERIQTAVELLDGKSPSLEGKDSPLLEQHRDGALVYGAAVDLGEIAQREGFFPILSQHERIYWSVGTENDQVFEDLKLIAHSEEVAEEMEEALQGLVALGKVWAADSESLKKLMEAAEVRRDGNTVQLTASSDSETVLDGLTDVRDRLRQRIGVTQ